MHPDGPSRCLIEMLHLGIVCFFISSMHPDESSECNYVCLFFYYFFNLHLHPGGLINEMTKIYFLNFWRESSIFTVSAKNNFYGFCEKCVLTKKCVFVVLAAKYVFYGFGGKLVFLLFWRELPIGGFDGKCVLWLWWKIRFCGFVIFVSDKMILGLNL